MNPMFPLLGPRQGGDLYPAWPDRAEVEECRRLQGRCLNPADNIEAYDTAAELGAARDLEEWGCNPFAED